MASATARPRLREWQRVDEQLRSIAKQYVALEAQLARWLRDAQRLNAW